MKAIYYRLIIAILATFLMGLNLVKVNAQEYPPNLITNGNFDNGKTGWITNSGAKIKWDGTNKYLRSTFASQKISVPAGGSVTVHANVKPDIGSESTDVSFELTVGSSTLTVTIDDVNGWDSFSTLHAANFDIPEGITEATLTVRLTSGNLARIDNVDAQAAQSTPSTPSIPSDIITNGNFDNGDTGWGISSGAKIKWDGTNKYLRSTFARQTISVPAGGSVTVRANVKPDSGSETTSVRFELDFGASASDVTIDGVNGWDSFSTPRTANFGIPVGVSEVTLTIRLASGNLARIDNVAVTTTGGGTGNEPVDSDGSPDRFSIDTNVWTLDPWSHEFDSASDLMRWHAPTRLGERDPDDFHVGKQTATGAEDNSAEFGKVIAVEDGKLVMKSINVPNTESSYPATKPQMPYLRTIVGENTRTAYAIERDDGSAPPSSNVIPFTPMQPTRNCTYAGDGNLLPPCDFVIDPEANDYYIEISAKFSEAQNAFKSWWAFWLFARGDANGNLTEDANYDGNVDTGMEVDIFEYVPYVEPDGFNAALFKRQAGVAGGDRRPEGLDFSANDERKTHGFLKLVNPEYQECTADGSCSPIVLNDGQYHTIGIIYTETSYTFYLDGFKYYEIDDAAWVTGKAKLGLQLTWEKDEGNVTEDRNGNNIPNYLENHHRPDDSYFDDLDDWQYQNEGDGNNQLSYGPWGQGFGTDIYNGECFVTVNIAEEIADRVAAERPQHEIDDVRNLTYPETFQHFSDTWGVGKSNMRIQESTCRMKTHSQDHVDSAVYIDYVKVWTKSPLLRAVANGINITSGISSTFQYFSSSTGGNTGTVRFADEDVLVFDPDSKTWTMYFDGSDVGLRSRDVDAFHILQDGNILLSLDKPQTIEGVRYDDSDIIKFTATSLGNRTQGDFSMYLDGSDVQLTKSAEDIDAIALLANGDLVISTLGTAKVSGVTARDEDLLRFHKTQLGNRTAGTWSLYLDGSDVKLSHKDEDIWAAWVDEGNEQVQLSTYKNYNAGGLRGDSDDIIACDGTMGSRTNCKLSLEWDGDAYRFGSELIDGYSVGPPPVFTVFSAAVDDAEDEPSEFDDESEDVLDDDEYTEHLYLPLINR